MHRPLALMMILVLLLLVGVMCAFLQAKRAALERSEAIFDRVSEEYQHRLQLEIDRFLWAAEVLASSKTVRALLAQPVLRANAASAREQSEILEEVAHDLNVDVIYVMDLSGNAVAASNWRARDSFVGHNYALRPYFKEGIAGQTGRYIAKGMTSNKVGYYLSRPVMVNGEIRGVVVAKSSLDAVQTQLKELRRKNGEIVLIADERGVVFVSPLSALMFKTVRDLPDSVSKVIESTERYGEKITPAPVTLRNSMSDSIHLVEFTDVPGQSFLQKAYYLPDLNLRLYQHMPSSRYWTIVAEFTGIAWLLALVAFLVCVGVYQRWAYGAKLMDAAIRDPLTGLNTRMYMNDWCDAAIRAHNRDPAAGFGLLVLDLDSFKQINDSFGHLAGDAVLRQVGEIVGNEIRGEDLGVRFGGEELAVFVRCADEAEAVALAERIRRNVELTQFQSKTGRMPVTLSGGVAYHAVGEAMDALFARADKMLYAAKNSGRNQICA